VIVYITEIVIDAINSIGSKKDANSGLTIPTTTTNKTEPTKSIDESFPERVVKQSNDLEQPKPEAVKYDETQSTE
jgi:hypothetical protein